MTSDDRHGYPGRRWIDIGRISDPFVCMYVRLNRPTVEFNIDL